MFKFNKTEELAEQFGVSNLIRHIISNQVSEEDKYYSIDGYGDFNMFSSIVYSEQSPMNLKEIAEKIIDKLEEKIDSDFEYEDECKYLIYEAKENGKLQKRIIEVTDNGQFSFMESKLTEIIGKEASKNLMDNDVLKDVFDDESNTNSNLASSHKKMKP